MKAIDVAHYIVYKCIADECPITNLTLQKLLFLIQCESLKRKGKKLFPDDFEAWRFGPCIPNVYYAFCHYGGMPIFCAEKVEIKFPVLDKTVIDRLIEQKRGLPPWELVRDAQRTGGAWDIVYQNGTDEKKVIAKGLMKVRRMTK